MKKFFLAGLIASLLSLNSGFAEVDFFPNVQEPRFEIGYSVGDFISVHHNYAELGLFIPASFNTWQPFIDVSGRRFDSGKWASSSGVGMRKILSGSTAIGVNSYYDYRRSLHRRDFHQVGFGLEWLTSCWDLRLNTYFPVGKTNQTSQYCRFNIGDGYRASRHLIDYAYRGFDAEFGVPLLRFCGLDLYAAAGPYFYQQKKEPIHRHFWGGFFRMELDWMTIFSIQLLASHDKIYHTNVQGIFQISIPFDFFCFNSCNESCGCECKLTQPVRRNGNIQLDDCCNWKWNW